jgi:hypothetical protein
MTKDSKKIKELIAKVKKLAERGEKGERENAKDKLKMLLDKYNITKFEESKVKERSFKLSDFNDCKVIMVHCIIDTNKDCEINGDVRKKELYCKLSDKEYVDVCEKFNHYYPEYYRQKESLIKAFIIKNDLGINGVEDDEMIMSEDEINGINEIINSIVKKPYKDKAELDLFLNAC